MIKNTYKLMYWWFSYFSISEWS